MSCASSHLIGIWAYIDIFECSTPAQLKSMKDVEDQIVPVRLDLEHDQWKLKDTFTWNCSGRFLLYNQSSSRRANSS